MERFTIIGEVGNGTFGNVWRALNKLSGEMVAIKKMKKKYYSWEECINLREVKSLRKIKHSNVVKLKDVIRENDVLYFIFEYMDCNLYQLMKGRSNLFSEVEVRNWCFQVFQGLACVHQRGYIHRDLKPENLLVSNDVIKIADFGLAREVNSQPPFTEYVSTRWYRAPEVLLQSSVYGPAVDMWAMGAIMAELFTLRPLFPGSSEADQMYKICRAIGSPTKTEWPQGHVLASAINYQFPQVSGVHLSMLMPGVNDDAINLISSLCSWDPCKRLTAGEALQHPFFQSCYYVPPSLRSKVALARNPRAITRGVLEQKCNMRILGNLNQKPENVMLSANSKSYLNSVQRKLELNNQDAGQDDKNQKNYIKQQPKYRPPVTNGTSGNWGKLPEMSVTDKLANMILDSGKPWIKPSRPPPLNAGEWYDQYNLFGGQSREFLPRRSCNWKVACLVDNQLSAE